MTKKRKTGLAIGLASACITVMCATGACNGIAKEEKLLCPSVTTSTTAIKTTTAPPTTPAPMTTTEETTAVTTTAPQITTTVVCVTTETTTAEQTTAADTTVQPTTTSTATTTTTPATTEPYHGQTSGDYIYINGFGWVFNEGGGGCGETNYEMYCNGNKIECFG